MPISSPQDEAPLIIDASTQQLPGEKGLIAWGWVSYVLHCIVALGAVLPGAQASLLLLLLALIVDVIKRPSDRSGWLDTHYAWRLRSMLWAALLYVLTLPLWLLLVVPGWLAWMLVSCWFLYRIVRGMVAFNRGQPLPR